MPINIDLSISQKLLCELLVAHIVHKLKRDHLNRVKFHTANNEDLFKPKTVPTTKDLENSLW